MHRSRDHKKIRHQTATAGNYRAITCREESTDEAAIAQCYTKLRNTAFGRLDSPQDAEDAVQNALIKASRQASQFRGDALYCTYLTRIVINESNNLLRKKIICQNRAALQQPAPQALMPENKLESKWILQAVKELIKNMPHSMRYELYLRFIKDCSYLEISRQMNCSIGTVKSRLARGRKLLQRKLAELYPEYTPPGR